MSANVENCKDNNKDNKGSKARRARAHVAILTANRSGDPVTVTYDKVSLKLSDVSLLDGPRFINEAIISFYYSYLENERYKSNSDMAFVPPDTAQCMLELDADEMEPIVSMLDLNKKPFVFFAFGDEEHVSQRNGGCIGGGTVGMTHFNLVVFSRPDKAFYYYDSCNGGNKVASKVTQHFVQELSLLMNCKVWTLKPIRGCTLLNAAYDCGIRVLCMTDNLADYINRFECVEGVGPLAQDTVSAKRSELLKLIYSLGGKITV